MVHPDLAALLVLQEKDGVVTGIEKAIEALKPEERALDSELEVFARALGDAQRLATAAEARKLELETRINGYKQQQERRRQQVEFVRGAKEASQLMAEIDMARGVLVREEADFLRSGDAIVEAEKKVKDAEKAHAAAIERQTEARASIAERRTALEADLAAARADRKTATRDVKPELLPRYERIRRGRTPTAVFPLHRGSCGHCNTAVPLARKVLIENGASIETCEGCGVLLYAAEA